MTIDVPIVTGLPRLYQKQPKHSQNSTKMTTGVPVVTRLPRLYQPGRVPTVYQKSQKADKTAKMAIGVPIVTGLPRLYQQCNNSLPIVNKNLAIANRSRVSCAHNTSRAFIGLNIYTVTLKSRLRVTQGHWKRNHWTDHTRLTISRVI